MIRAIALSGLILAAAGNVAIAGDQGGQGGRRERRHQRVERMADAIQLTDTQRGAIRQLREKEREAGRALHESMKSAALNYRRLRDANNPRADDALEAFSKLRQERAARRLALRAEIETLFTPEQRQKLEEMRKQKGRGRAD